MATSFPSGLDALTNPTSGNTLASPDHAGQHADANDAIEALEAKVGVNGSAVTSSLDYMVAASKVVTDKVDPASASTNQVLKYNGTKFVPATGASVTVADSPPTSPTPQAGDQWYESDSGRQLIYYDGFWVEIGSTATTNVNANDLSGTTLASNVVSSSLTSFGSSPVLAGTPTAPTATAGTNTTQVATMASKPWNTAWGVVGYTGRTTNITISSSTTVMSQNFTAVTGRLYKITHYEPVLYNTGAGYTIFFIRNGATLLKESYMPNRAANEPSGWMEMYIGTFTAGSTTINIVATSTNTSPTNNSATASSHLIIEDIGPA